MQNLVVKRQKIAKDMRRKEVQSYMAKIRQKLVSESSYGIQKPLLTEQNLQIYKKDMKDSAYTQDSVIDFLQTIKAHQYQNFHQEQLLTYMSQGMEYHLLFGQHRQGNNKIKELSEEILTRLLRFIRSMHQQQITKQIENFMQEILDVISNANFQMIEIWKQASRIYHEKLVHKIFHRFIRYIDEYPSDIFPIVHHILTIFVNFTALFDQNPSVILSTNQVYQIIILLETIIVNITFSDLQLSTTIVILNNLFESTSGEVSMLQVFNRPQIYQQLFGYLQKYEEKSINKTVISKLLQFIAKALCGPSQLAIKILHNYKNLGDLLMQFLPAQSAFNHFLVIQNTNDHNYNSMQKELFNSAMLCLCNMVGTHNCLIFLMQTKILKRVFYLSTRPESFILDEVSIFIFNCVFISSQEELGIIIQYDLLDALCTITKNVQQKHSLVYCLSTLITIFKKSQNFPKNNPGWRFSKENILNTCNQYGLYKYLQSFITCNDQRLSNLSVICLNLMPFDNPNGQQNL